MERTLDTPYGRTSPEPLVATKDRILEPCLKKSQRPRFQCLNLESGQVPEWSEGMGIVLLGESVMRNTGESPSVVRESFLSQILEVNVPEKYFLSAKATIGILRRAAKRGKELPNVLRIALEEQSGLRRDTFGEKEVADTGALLRELRSFISPEIFKEWIRGTFAIFQQKEILLCHMFRRGDCEKKATITTKDGESWTATCKKTNFECPMCHLWQGWKNVGTPQRRESFQQLIRQLGKVMHELSQENTPTESFLRCLWSASEGVGSLFETLASTQESIKEGLGHSIHSEYSESFSREAREETAGSVRNGVETTGAISVSVKQQSLNIGYDLANTLGANDYKEPQVVCRPIAFNGRQDPVYGQVTGAIDTDRATQCIAYPEPANALLAKGNLSYRADVDNLVCAVDIRNLYETEELSETLQSKQTGGYSLNYQNPVRVPIGGINYGNADKTNAREILFALWREIGTEAFCKWAVRVVEYFQQKGILQPEMYGEGVREQTETEIGKLGNESFQIEKNCSTGSLRNMRKTECFRCTPQRRGLDKQRTRESSKDLSELSQLKAQAEKALRHLWGSSKGLWIMYKALTEIQEARRSDDRKDKSEEEMQSMRRTCSLERALWDALYESEKSREPVRYAVRRLLPLECERLQSMPDGWTDIPDASDTARYKAIGNSLVMNIADWIFSQIVKAEKGEL